jgi:glyoxylase I family protein
MNKKARNDYRSRYSIGLGYSLGSLFGKEQGMICIREIDHIVLRVSGLQRMLHFYCDVLGCPIERRQDEIGLVQLRAGSSLIDLVPVDGKLGRMGGAAPGAEGRNMDHFCLRVEPFDDASIRAHLAAHGVAAGAVESRYGAEGEGPSIYLTDPEGNVVELKGPPAA